MKSKILSTSSICSTNPNIVTIGHFPSETVAHFDSHSKAKEFNEKLNQAIEEIFNEVTKGETEPAITTKEQEMVQRCMNLSEQIRSLADELVTKSHSQIEEIKELLKQHSLAWSELNSEFGDKFCDLAEKPYYDDIYDFGDEELIDWIKSK